MKTEYLRRDPFPQSLLPPDTHWQPPLPWPGLPQVTSLLFASLPQLAPTGAQVSPCAKAPGAYCSLLQQGAGTLPSSTLQGEFFKPSLIRETIGGWEKGKRKVVDSIKVCQNSGGTLKTSQKRKEREGKLGRHGDPPDRPTTHPSRSLILGVGVRALEKSEGLVTDLALSHSV